MSGQGIAQFIPLILIFVIFYFFLIRPQQKRVKEHKEMVKNLKRGDEVITSGGIIGVVERVFPTRYSIFLGHGHLWHRNIGMYNAPGCLWVRNVDIHGVPGSCGSGITVFTMLHGACGSGI